MKRVIKVTEKQLRETEGDAFEYLDFDNDVPSSKGNSQVNVCGKTDDNEYGKPATTDKIANDITTQGYLRYSRSGVNLMPLRIHETDMNNDGVDDFYNHDELAILTDDNENNNLIKIPQTVEQRLNTLIDSIKNLHGKQQAMILNKLIESIKLNEIPYSWGKELIEKIRSKNNISKN